MGGGGQVHGVPSQAMGEVGAGWRCPHILVWVQVALSSSVRFSLWMKLEEQVPLLVWTPSFR